MTAERDVAAGHAARGSVAEPERGGMLLDETGAARYRRLWDDIQAGFVDEPRSSVAAADALVREVIGELVRGFDARREALETSWREGEEVSTEDLRRALQAYRAFFAQLVET